ncbi:MAG: GNAT family N-acetyltransferase [Planctomycetota bacterium]
MTTFPDGYSLRRARDDDARALQELVARCFLPYPGVVLDARNEETDLLAPGSAFEVMWIVEDGAGGVAACIAARTHREADPAHVELKKLYVDPAHRGRGLARPLVGLVEAYAKERDLARVELWSDTKFATAHAVYERLGYLGSGRTRELGDVSLTAEFHYAKDLGT